VVLLIPLQIAEKQAAFSEAVKERHPYYHKRIELFEKYHAREEAAIEAAKAANVPLKVILPDGAVKEGIKGVTTPLDVANQISKSLAKKVVVAKVDGDTWDLFRPLEGDCSISLHTFDDEDGKEVRGGGGGGGEGSTSEWGGVQGGCQEGI
jgi:threonyl-tRNA synthetase